MLARSRVAADRRGVVIILFVSLLAIPTQAFGMGADYGPEELKFRAGSVGGQTPVHGYWVNWEDMFFYAGDAAAFNQFIDSYSQLKHRQLKVVLHRGPKQAASPWKQLDLAIDWSLYVWNSGASFIHMVKPGDAGDHEIELQPIGPPAPTRVDVWVGGRLELPALRIPASLEVTAAVDAAQDVEIQKYLAARSTSAAAAPASSPSNAEVLLLTIELADGSRLRGEAVTVKEVPLQTALSKLSIPPRQIAEVRFSADPHAAVIQFGNGDRLTGAVSSAEWGDQKLQTAVGEIVVPARLMRLYRIEGIVAKPQVSVRASGSWEVSVPDRAFDGRRDTDWNSGDYAPAWIEADLSSAAQLANIRLIPAQDIAGPTAHEIWISEQPIGDDRTHARLIHTFEGETTNSMELRFDFPEHTTARFVQVRTTQSPTWISWWEVEIRVANRRCESNGVGQ